jgi:hypothetical protein
MRKLFTLLLLLVSIQLLAQSYPIYGISISLPANPDVSTLKWASGSSMLTISARAELIAGRVEDRVRDSRILVTIKKNGSKICGTYTGNSAPAANFSAANKIWNGSNAVLLIGQDCSLSPGDYEICVQFFGQGPAGNMALSEEKCKPFTIRGNNQESYQAPILLSPANGFELNENDALKPLTFRWSQIPKPPSPVTYRLRIWQLIQGQNESQTIRNSEPFIIKDVKDVMQAVGIQLKQTGPGRDMIWNVQALNREGKPVGENNGTSEAFTINITPVNDPPSVIHLISPANKSTVDLLKGYRFTWSHEKQHPGPPSIYRIRIVPINTGQTAQAAMIGNKPFFEKDSIGERMFFWPAGSLDKPIPERMAWQVIGYRNPPYGEVKPTESEINEFIIKSVPPSCPVINVTSNFNCNGFSVGSIVTNTSSTLNIVSWTISSPNTVLVNNGVQTATGVLIPMVGMPGSVPGINAGQTVNAGSIGVLQPNGGSTMILIYTFHLSNGQTCEVEKQVTWYPNCAASLCACGTWNSFDYGYYPTGVISGTAQQIQLPLSGNAGTITVLQGSRIFPGTGFNCTGNCGNENYTYDLYRVGDAAPIISHTWGANLSDDGTVLEHQFECGNYVLTIYPTCSGATVLQCAVATIQIQVTCTNPCSCGLWNPVTVKVGSGSLIPVSCDNVSTPVAVNVSQPITINATINCNPVSTSCAGTQLADIFYPNGNLAAGNVSLPLTNWTFPLQNFCGIAKVVLKGKCNTMNCTSCTIYFDVACPPPPVCSCNWSQTAWTNNGITQTKFNACGETLHTTEGNMLFFPAYSCSPSVCAQTTATYTITNNGIVMGAPNRPVTTATGILTPGTYQVSFSGSCNGTVCTCSVTIIVDPLCSCASWNTIPFTDNGVTQPPVNPTGVVSGNPGSSFLFSPTYSCNPAASCAQSAVTYTITTNGIVSGPFPITTPTGVLPNGISLVRFYGNCGGTVCTTTLRINITGSLCSCNGWNKLVYRDEHNGADYQKINCEKDEVITIHREQQLEFILQPDCKGCEPSVSLNIFYPGNSGSVPDETFTTYEVNYSFRDCGEYRVQFKGSCGGSACKECWVTVKVDCPPTTCSCSGITAISFRRQGSSTDTVVQCQASPVIINVMQGDLLAKLAAQFSCAGPASCLQTSFVDIYNPNSTGFTTHALGGDHPFGFRFEICGTYTLVFKGKCGTVSCSSCTIKVNVSPSCCNYINPNSLQFNKNTGVFSVSFTTNSNLVFSKVKVQILELTSAGNAKPSANLKVLNKASTPAWGAGNRNVAITGTSVTNQATALWYPPPGPWADAPANLPFTGQLAYFSPLTTPVKLIVRFTFYRNDPGCGNTICEKDLTFTN